MLTAYDVLSREAAKIKAAGDVVKERLTDLHAYLSDLYKAEFARGQEIAKMMCDHSNARNEENDKVNKMIAELITAIEGKDDEQPAANTGGAIVGFTLTHDGTGGGALEAAE